MSNIRESTAKFNRNHKNSKKDPDFQRKSQNFVNDLLYEETRQKSRKDKNIRREESKRIE